MKQFHVFSYVPFDPVTKVSEAIVLKDGDPHPFQVCKGAPQIVLGLCKDAEAIAKDLSLKIQVYASSGYRAIAIASRNYDQDKWVFKGLIPISDPPRVDSIETIRKVKELGIKVVMVTGDQMAIAKEIGRVVGLEPKRFIGSKMLADNMTPEMDLYEHLPLLLEDYDGFAEVFPEHKFMVVNFLRQGGHCVGMTGDGVNDAPALKLANVGIAVEGATEAARAASSMFLQEPGLHVIVDAINVSKKVFERIKSYFIFRFATSINLMGFFFFAGLLFQPSAWTNNIELLCPASLTVSMIDGIHNMGWQAKTQFWQGMTGNESVAWFFTQHIPSQLLRNQNLRTIWWQYVQATCNSFTNVENTVLANCCFGLTNSATMDVFFLSPTIIILLCTILNDFTIVSIAFDSVRPSSSPDKWQLWKIIAVSTVLGLGVLVASFYAFRLFLESTQLDNPTGVLSKEWQIYMTYPQVLTATFLQLGLAGRLCLFNSRTVGWFWEMEMSKVTMITMILCLMASMCIAVYWPFSGSIPPTAPIPWTVAIYILAFNLVMFMINDIIKLFCYWVINLIEQPLERMAKKSKDRRSKEAHEAFDKYNADHPKRGSEFLESGSKSSISKGSSIILKEVKQLNRIVPEQEEMTKFQTLFDHSKVFQEKEKEVRLTVISANSLNSSRSMNSLDPKNKTD